jgi:hypothetical protein
MQFFKKFIDDSVKWCKGKFPYFRALLLLYFVYILFRYLSNPDYNSFFNGLNLGIHELGHFIFSPFGEFMHFLGGSLTEIIFPIIGILMFYFQKDYLQPMLLMREGWNCRLFHPLEPIRFMTGIIFFQKQGF